MTWVITRRCRDCMHTSCVSVCPVDCIYRYAGSSPGEFPNQLFIDPEECIDCGACEPVCPWDAIFKDVDVPPELQEDVELNAKVADRKEDFEVPEELEKPMPTDQDVERNKAKWGT